MTDESKAWPSASDTTCRCSPADRIECKATPINERPGNCRFLTPPSSTAATGDTPSSEELAYILERIDSKYALSCRQAAARLRQLERELAEALLAADRYEEGWEWECKQGDKICEAAGIQRTEGGSLNPAKIINALREQGKASPSAIGAPVAWMLVAKGCKVGPCETVESIALGKAAVSEWMKGGEVVPLYTAPRPETSAIAAVTFEQMRDAIVTRMGGHTFPKAWKQQWDTFFALLKAVKASECGIAPRPETLATCEWRQDSDGCYDTGCGHKFFFDTGTAEENGAKFCQYCGGSMKVVAYQDPDDAEHRAEERPINDPTRQSGMNNDE